MENNREEQKANLKYVNQKSAWPTSVLEKPNSLLLAYYGLPERLRLVDIQKKELVILQTTLYNKNELLKIRQQGCRVLGYLSLGEDHSWGDTVCIPGSEAYHIKVNSIWGSVMVNIAHPEWQRKVLSRARDALKNADGLFLDTVDHGPADEMIKLVKLLRFEFPDAIFWINRGCELLRELIYSIDGVIFESLSTFHTPKYCKHDEQGLLYTKIQIEYIHQLGIPVLAIDYADSIELTQFAHQRANELKVSTFVTDKLLWMPSGT